MNITYMFGAGASFYACPVWKEQGYKMIQLRDIVMDSYEKSGHYSLNNIINEIVEFGKKANEFNTVDTYAKKLYLLKDYENLKKLKRAVSMFFTLWTLTNNSFWKNLSDINMNEPDRSDNIDHRYIDLLANYLEEGEKYPQIKSNLKFITWNYDLQIESAYNKFTDIKENNFKDVDRYFPFNPNNHKDSDLVVCHLNGFHGFYGNNPYSDLFNKLESKDLLQLLKIFDIMKNEDIVKFDFTGYINFAWEKESSLATAARKQAYQILNKTDILVIVGYSFPPFNNVIDKELFKIVRERNIRVVYQDPMANRELLIENFGIDSYKIVIVNNNMNQFVIPYFHSPEKVSPKWHY